ncbi:arginase family protein [Brevibacillus sp. SYP-B805]|uniref:arginase family protein n=1 Tax=Brevibacillus sp. SYP-B805 TaxID=1578199 RepID=UPI0013EAF66D|nr:arginase family protein [Brevibacillus sp. SYP-B805]NGQ93893.1 arginase family protein [Brevibacillus sp. SYP-B805]
MKRYITLLNFDGTLTQQKLLSRYPGEWIDLSDIRGSQGYCEMPSLQTIKKRLQSRKYKGITLIGNGNYHYVSYLLLSELKQPFSLVLFDHHTDLALHEDGSMISCGSWVTFALNTYPLLQHVVIIGANTSNGRFDAGKMPGNVTVISENEVKQSSVIRMEAKLRALLKDQPVYISVDKDVLDKNHATTNWDQGSMTLLQLLELIRDLKQSNPVLGVDICGELPLSPVDVLSPELVRHMKKNEKANRAIVDVVSAS